MSTRPGKKAINAPVMHKCPEPSCKEQVPPWQFACSRHWFWLPKPLRDRIWQTFKSEDLQGHTEAMIEAVRFLRDAGGVAP